MKSVWGHDRVRGDVMCVMQGMKPKVQDQEGTQQRLA